MKTYSINYNLINPGRDYSILINKIKAIASGWCHCGGSHWFINSNLSTAQIRDSLSVVLDPNDQLIIHSVGDDWSAWNMGKAVTDWLHANWRSSCLVR